MPYHALLEYVRKATDAGVQNVDIETHLRRAGWYTVDIRDALEFHAKLAALPISLPTRQPSLPRTIPAQVGPRHYDPKIIAVAALSFALAFVAYLVIAHS